MTNVSDATKRNFKKLNKDLNNHKFTRRANKTDSTKSIIPDEYYQNKQNAAAISDIIKKIKHLNPTVAINTAIAAFLIQKKLVQTDKGCLHSKYEFLNRFVSDLEYDDSLIGLNIPLDEDDPLGIIYQQLITEGEKNKTGSYYTPPSIAAQLTNITPNKASTFCDPCCGTGMFLINALRVFDCNNIYGYDIDPVAVNIAKANMFARRPETDFNSRIICKDFLSENNRQFDYIITNPPWGSSRQFTAVDSIVKSKEMFSHFIESSLKALNNGGHANFVLPVSVLNVKTHKDIREFILNGYTIRKIRCYGKCFKGVLTDVISLSIYKPECGEYKNKYEFLTCLSDGTTFDTPIEATLSNNNHNICLVDNTDLRIIDKIRQKGTLNLEQAEFALGIVTGDNEHLITTVRTEQNRPIITGKDIHRYYISNVTTFTEYDRSKFQQVCPDRFFAAQSKFVYKFISKKMIFALDENQMLTLNSANIMLLPQDFPMNKYVVLALLNSRIFNFYFAKVINQIKILKNDIQSLPLPLLPSDIQDKLTDLVKKNIETKSDNTDTVDEMLLNYYELDESERKRINI